ncbi:MAG: hypothetical protein R3335_03715 [Anaerolineales bacterium]|nr:hypothetical protein [Anaerolineales bacterium]
MSPEESPSYQSYLLRCWQEESSEWRFRLQDVQTGEQTGFTDLNELLEFLRALIDENPYPDR